MKNKNRTTKTEANDLATIQDVLSTTIINHDGLKDAYQMIQQTMKNNKYLAENKHAIIIGESGCGKSTLMDLYKAEYCPSVNEFELGSYMNMPAIFSSVPSPVTPKAMSVELIKSTGDKTGLTQTAQQITERFRANIKNANTQAVFMDETQHLLSIGSKNNKQTINTKLRESLDWIKSLTNKTNTTYILLGMPELLDVIDADEQMARRFTNTIYLGPFKQPDANNSLLVDFTDELLLKASEITLEVNDSEYFEEIEYFQDHQEDAKRLFVATKGNPSNIKSIVIHAACIAYKDQSREIKMSHFAKAFEALEKTSIEAKKSALLRQKLKLRLNSSKQKDYTNPFIMDMDQIELNLSELEDL